MPLNCGAREGSSKYPGEQGDQTSESSGRSTLNTHWKDWYWSWSSSILVIWCEKTTHWKSPWCWERLRAEGETGNRGWDGWMASLTQWTWVCTSSFYCIGDAIQPSHPLLPSSPSAFNLSQNEGLFQSVSSLHQVGLCIGASAFASVLSMNFQVDFF